MLTNSSWLILVIAFILITVITALVVLLISQRRLFNSTRSLMQSQLQETQQSIEEARQRLAAVFRISQKFVEASDENEIIDLVLYLSLQLTGAIGVSYVPLDERGHPLASTRKGEFPNPISDTWLEYLASPVVRQKCQNCKSESILTSACPLLKGPFTEAAGLYCLPLRRGDREFGVLNLFLPDTHRLKSESQSFMHSLVDETALALDGIRLRRRDLDALRQIQAVRQKTDLSSQLSSLLENITHTLEADFALLVIRDSKNVLLELKPVTPIDDLAIKKNPPGEIDFSTYRQVSWGEIPSQELRFLSGILQDVFISEEPIVINRSGGTVESMQFLRSVLAIPLPEPDQPGSGVLLLASQRPDTFRQREVALLQTIAGQAVLVIQNAHQNAALEFRSIIAERSRLAREIHDGLAQSLGFIKLQLAQIHLYLEKGQFNRLEPITLAAYQAVADAYQDAREAIDGLRMASNTDTGQIGDLIQQTVCEFQDNTNLSASFSDETAGLEVPPEIQSQLIRIVQEALSNVRKHSQAEQIWVAVRHIDEDLHVVIQDNGCGFSAEDVPATSRYGLRGMRERAELIGADFQIISQSSQGTTVRIRLPLSEKQRLEH